MDLFHSGAGMFCPSNACSSTRYIVDIIASVSWVCLGAELPLEMVEAIADEIISYKD
jgi:hypothetical protein